MSQQNLSLYLLYSQQEKMCTLLTSQSLPLLLLLLQPLPLQVLMLGEHDFSDEMEEKFKDYLDELHSTGPTRPPTKESFQKHVMLAPDYKLDKYHLCTSEMLARNIHNRYYCRKEHFFLYVAYEELQKACHTKYVACKNGVRKCHKTKEQIEGAYCALKKGINMPVCEYETTYKKGYALITCRWQNDIGEIIPEYVNNIL